MESNLTSNKSLLTWLDEKVELLKPSNILWIDGSKEQIDALKKEAVETGEMVKLNDELLPDCYLHRTAENDVARVEDRTLICTTKEEDAGPTNHWMAPDKCYKMLYDIAAGSYEGRTMYIIPYSMGPVGSPMSKIGIEITDSIYVVLNMNIMTRVGKKVLDALGDSNDWVRGMHCKCDVDPEKRWICQFPEDNTIISVNSAYGGNVLLGKKCFALRIASYLGKNEGWQAEHMLILGLQKPNGDIKYICAAFPSACGKTNLAMLIPPEGYQRKGYKVWCVGDDISWIKKGPDGRLYAINPENGFFGVAPGTNEKSNPNALASTKKGTIFTNVALNLDNNTVWWEGLDKNPPANAIDWKGNHWNGQTSEEKGAHPNSRFTAPAVNCPCISSEFENPNGVPISAFVFGGRRAKLTPLVYQSKSWNHGVFEVQLWVLKQLLLQQVKLALFVVTLWQCSHSAATIWAIIGSTGLKSVNLLMKIKHLRFSMLTGSVKMTKATSYGLVLVITSEFLIGLLTVAKARLTLRKQLSVIFHMLRILTLKALI